MRRDASTRHRFPDDVVGAVLASVASPTRSPRDRPLLLGLSGLQGSGKSTLARQLAAAACARGIPSIALSIDDFYLGRRARSRLAREVHPLLATRGVPGTHDLDLLHATIDALAHATRARPTRIPRFDKGRDARRVPSRWPRVSERPRLVILEGWCIGLPAQPESALRHPCNALEQNEDPARSWRRWVNLQLAGEYAAAWRRLDRLVLLQAPDAGVVARWRGEQERALLARNAPHAMDAAAMRRFLLHTERLGKHALRTLPGRADLRLLLDRDRRVTAVRGAARR